MLVTKTCTAFGITPQNITINVVKSVKVVGLGYMFTMIMSFTKTRNFAAVQETLNVFLLQLQMPITNL